MANQNTVFVPVVINAPANDNDNKQPSSQQTGAVAQAKNLGSKALPAYDLAGLAQLPPLVYTVAGYMPFRSLILVFGPSGHGKTFLVLDQILSIATGREWHGHSTRQGLVMYVAGEGKHGIRDRAHTWCVHHKAGVSIPVIVFPRAVNLLDADDVDLLINEAKKIAKQFDMPIEVIAIDTVARCFGDGDENTQRDMNKFVASADRVRTTLRTSVVLIHHTPKGRLEARGSNALTGAVDTSISVEYKNKAERIIEVSVVKQKDGPEAPPRHFKLERVQYTNPISQHQMDSCVLVPVNANSLDADDDKPRLGKNQGVFFEAISESGAEGVCDDDLRAIVIERGVDLERSATFKATLRELDKKGLITFCDGRWISAEVAA